MSVAKVDEDGEAVVGAVATVEVDGAVAGMCIVAPQARPQEGGEGKATAGVAMEEAEQRPVDRGVNS